MGIFTEFQVTIWNGLTYSPEGSLAPTCRKPESEPDSPMRTARRLAQAFGLNSVLLAKFDPDTFVSRTFQECLFQEQCPEFSETFPDSGMWDAGSVYELQTSERVTSGNEFSLWPTAVAKDDGKTPEAHLAMKQRMGERDGTGANRTAITSLAVKVQQWPTAKADAKNGRRGNELSGSQRQ